MVALIVVLTTVAVLAMAVQLAGSKNVCAVGVLVLLALGLGSYQVFGIGEHLIPGQAVLAQDAPEATSETTEAEGGTITDEESVPEAGAEAESSEPEEAELAIDTGEVVIPDRPEWVESDPVRTGKVHTVAVASGPQEHERECRKALDKELQQSVAEYIDEYLGKVYGEKFKASTFVSYDTQYIKDRLVGPENMYHEVIKLSFGPMQQSHALLEFDTAFRKELDGRRQDLDKQWRKHVVAGRLVGIALAFGVCLSLLGVVFGYFRIDTATRGYYTGRLQFTSATVILAVIVAGILLAIRML